MTKILGTCEALTTAKFIHGFLEPEDDILISLIIENPDSNISHALLSAVISDWYELYSRLNGKMADSSNEDLTSFFDACIANMPIYRKLSKILNFREIFNFFFFDLIKATPCRNYFEVSTSVGIQLPKWIICIWFLESPIALCPFLATYSSTKTKSSWQI